MQKCATTTPKHISDTKCIRKFKSSIRLCSARSFLINSIKGAMRRREFHPPATRPLGQIRTYFSLYFIRSAPKGITVHFARGLAVKLLPSQRPCWREPLLTKTTRNDSPFKSTDTSGHSLPAAGKESRSRTHPDCRTPDPRPSCATPSNSAELRRQCALQPHPPDVAARRLDPT